MKMTTRGTLILTLVAAPALAQVEARQATKEEALAVSGIQQLKSPMLLEVPFKTKSGGSVFELFRLGSQVWRNEETARFVCDKARVLGIEVTQEKLGKDRMRLRIATPVGTDWFRQDVNYALAFVAGGEVVGSRTWRAMTIGTPAGGLVWGGSSSKTPSLEIDRSLSEWLVIERMPNATIRMLVEIADDED